jgi:hypothetical protein
LTCNSTIAIHSPSLIYFRTALRLQPCGVIHVMTAQRAAQRTITMTTFTIDTDNNITAHATPEEAAASTTTPFDSFSTQQELVELAKGAPVKGKAAHKAHPAKKAPRAKKAAAAAPVITAARPGSKTAQVVAMLQRKNGATLAEIMRTMGWQKHTVRGFMAGAMKKAGHAVESFKPAGGERTYRIN